MTDALPDLFRSIILFQSITAALIGASAYLVTHSAWPSLRPNQPDDKTLDFARLASIIGLAMGSGVVGAMAVMGYIDVAGWLTELGKLFPMGRSGAADAAASRLYSVYLVTCDYGRCTTSEVPKWPAPTYRHGLMTSEFLAIAAMTYVGLDGPAFFGKIKDFFVSLKQPNRAGG